MQPEIRTHNSFKIIGVELKTTIENNENIKQIPEFWEKYREHNYDKKIPNLINSETCYGICTNFNDSNVLFSYIIGREVSTLSDTPRGFTGITIPKSKYAIFNVKGPVPDAIQNATKTIYGEWFPKSGKERADTPDFELYDNRMYNNPPEMDIYIPIK